MRERDTPGLMTGPRSMTQGYVRSPPFISDSREELTPEVHKQGRPLKHRRNTSLQRSQPRLISTKARRVSTGQCGAVSARVEPVAEQRLGEPALEIAI